MSFSHNQERAMPFTVEEFMHIFGVYNLAVWPVHILMYILAFAAIFFAFRPGVRNSQIITAVLSFFWLWIGIFYHLLHFTAINSAAYVFGSIFILQGLLWMYALVSRNLYFHYHTDSFSIIGWIFIIYALLVYPLLGALMGHSWPNNPQFGVAPCPTTIFTFGILLWTTSKVPWWLMLIPLIWSVIGFFAAISLGVAQDIGLLVAGVAGFVLVLIKNKRVPDFSKE
jgi:hypothetical protein